MMRSLIEYLGCGNVYKSGDRVSYEVTKISDLENKIIPLFNQFPILGVKALDYSDFCRAVSLRTDNKLSPEDKLEPIRIIKAGMNKGRK